MASKAFKDIIGENGIPLDQAVHDLRQRFFEWYDVNSNEYDNEDVKHLRDNDYYCQRFLAHRIWLDGAINVNKTFDMVKSVFKWRKEFGANHLKDSDFPEEFLTSGEVHPYRKDKEGNVTILLRFCKHVKSSKRLESYQRFLIHNLEKIEQKYDRRKPVTLLVDTKGAGLHNVEIPLVFFMRSTLLKQYPLFLARVIVLNMPSLFTAIWKLVKSLLPQRIVERFIFADDNTIFDYIDIEDLPEDMGGLDKTVYPLEDTMSNLPESLLKDIQAMKVSM